MAMRWMWMALVVVGCGPVVATDGDSSTGDSPGTNTSADPVTTGSPGTSSPPNPTTFTSTDTATDGPADESATLDTGVDFIMVPDHDRDPWCDLWNDECPRGTKCMPWANDGGSAWNATKCTPLAEDPRAPGEPCTVVDNGVSGVDDCEQHAMCWNADPETNMGECVAFCEGTEANPICEDESSHCNISGDGVLVICLPICNPLEADCSEGQACVPIPDTFECAPDAGGATGAAGEVCEFVNVCDPGLFCSDADNVPECAGAGCCTPFCELGDPSVCEVLGPEVDCLPWYEPGQAPPGFETLGACLLPP
ncbi:MAG: hypothetical protein IAG13_04615 [Deltaproteobacteria bacterium]|nr:hypothetical protein [Nannocystaceae bacterium]